MWPDSCFCIHVPLMEYEVNYLQENPGPQGRADDPTHPASSVKHEGAYSGKARACMPANLTGDADIY